MPPQKFTEQTPESLANIARQIDQFSAALSQVIAELKIGKIQSLMVTHQNAMDIALHKMSGFVQAAEDACLKARAELGHFGPSNGKEG